MDLQNARRLNGREGEAGSDQLANDRVGQSWYGRRMAGLEKVSVDEAAGALQEFWSQRVVARANGNLIKVAKGIRSTTWHAHDDQDEVFLVTRGELVVQLRSGDVTLRAGEMLVVPRGIEHCPRADGVVHLLLIGPEITSNEAGGKPAWSYDAGEPPADGG
jgi:mannose-6-phosphate isomerase-like protein (cupin superfamily)